MGLSRLNQPSKISLKYKYKDESKPGSPGKRPITSQSLWKVFPLHIARGEVSETYNPPRHRGE